MNSQEIYTSLLHAREQLRTARDQLKTTSKALMDEDKRRHILRSLASVELALRELAAILWPGGRAPME